jgi:hypothetical protein
MPNQLHHVVMLSHSATRFIGFLTDVVGMEVQLSFRVPGETLETTLGWPPSEGADVTTLGMAWQGSSKFSTFPNSCAQPHPKDSPRCLGRRLRHHA